MLRTCIVQWVLLFFRSASPLSIFQKSHIWIFVVFKSLGTNFSPHFSFKICKRCCSFSGNVFFSLPKAGYSVQKQVLAFCIVFHLPVRELLVRGGPPLRSAALVFVANLVLLDGAWRRQRSSGSCPCSAAPPCDPQNKGGSSSFLVFL